jgi:hypothetical protein
MNKSLVTGRQPDSGNPTVRGNGMVRPAPPTSPGATHTVYAHHELRRVNFTVMARKASPAFPKTWPPHKPACAETARVMRTGKHAHSIRARGSITTPDDAGYMAGTASSTKQRSSSCTAGRTIYEGGLRKRERWRGLNGHVPRKRRNSEACA